MNTNYSTMQLKQCINYNPSVYYMYYNLFLILYMCWSVLARPNGAPEGRCESMMPGHGTSGQSDPAPYEITISSECYVPGQTYQGKEWCAMWPILYYRSKETQNYIVCASSTVGQRKFWHKHSYTLICTWFFFYSSIINYLIFFMLQNTNEFILNVDKCYSMQLLFAIPFCCSKLDWNSIFHGSFYTLGIYDFAVYNIKF